MKRLSVLLFVILACSRETPAPATNTAAAAPSTPPPTVAQARDLIANSAEFGDFEFTNASFTTPVNLATASEPVRASAKELADAGWITIENNTVALTPKSRGDKRFLMRDNGLLDIVPLAKKEMGDVTAITGDTATFTWHWVANEVGASFKTGTLHERFAAPRTSKATLIWDGSNWSVLKIE